ncbi:gene transfer agent family protein [Brucella intermedia]|uniref:gene transfer agent family protein n=1 Tax=Brucella intermedia TaxID=94625 RepID=UPI002449BC93|nr:gene transfer agent family protein [Brucella intermedia]WGG61946.1 gene transfer agent family protein [Brucella intermedia]
MSRDAKIELDWADGTYTFRLGWGEFSRLQEACDAGPWVILERVKNNEWKTEDLRETIRYGLIGAGMEPTKALKLVREYVETRPLSESVVFAHLILSAGIFGAPEEKVGEHKAAKRTKKSSTASRTGKSASPLSTAMAL